MVLVPLVGMPPAHPREVPRSHASLPPQGFHLTGEGHNPCTTGTPLALSSAPTNAKGTHMIILGVILLILGLVLDISILYTIGIILLVVGAVLWILGATGRAVGGRKHFF